MANKGSTPKTMKALVAYAKDDYRFEAEYPAPTCGPDDIIIKQRHVESVPAILSAAMARQCSGETMYSRRG